MKQLTILILITFICILWVLGRPGRALKQGGEAMEAQEIPQEQEESSLVTPTRPIRVVYTVRNISEGPIADIIWLKKAADTALRYGSPYFNVVDQEIGQHFSERQKTELTIVKGLIELSDDPMEAQYDAYEIKSLVYPTY